MDPWICLALPRGHPFQQRKHQEEKEQSIPEAEWKAAELRSTIVELTAKK